MLSVPDWKLEGEGHLWHHILNCVLMIGLSWSKIKRIFLAAILTCWIQVCYPKLAIIRHEVVQIIKKKTLYLDSLWNFKLQILWYQFIIQRHVVVQIIKKNHTSLPNQLRSPWNFKLKLLGYKIVDPTYPGLHFWSIFEYHIYNTTVRWGIHP